jgi:hypothetical protein
VAVGVHPRRRAVGVVLRFAAEEALADDLGVVGEVVQAGLDLPEGHEELGVLLLGASHARIISLSLSLSLSLGDFHFSATVAK